MQELAFTFANTIEYVKQAHRRPGSQVDEFAPRLSFFFAAHNDLFEEVAKFRAARRMYARLMRERFGAIDASCRLRFHTQTGGVTLTAQQPLNNVVRVTVQALAADARRHAVAAHERLRRGARAADARGGDARAAHAADRRLRVRRREHGRSAGGQLLRRGADRRARAARARADRAGRRAGRRGARDRSRVLSGGDRAQRVRASAARRERARPRRRREPVRRWRGRRRRSRRPTSRRSSASRSRALRGASRANATRRRVERRSPRIGEAARAVPRRRAGDPRGRR